MTTFKVLLEYDGSRYSGWQDQKNARTVMGELRRAAREVFRSDVEMQGAGRTDAGVHALGQVAHIKVTAPVRYKPDVIKSRMNDLLPADIVVLEVSQVHRSFHARHDAVSRIYRYQISNRKQAFMKKYVWWVKEPLNLDLMNKAAAMLVGRHDFICFRAEDPARPHEPTIVVVEGSEIEVEDDIIIFRIEASHFLWRMVRRIVGVLVRLGTGQITEQDFQKLLSGQCDSTLDVAAWTAPASGLFLEHVRYPESHDPVRIGEQISPPGQEGKPRAIVFDRERRGGR
jgi:tRNA pseudouridine38-40 synthase